MENKVIITFRENGHRIEGTITKPQMIMVSADILAAALHFTTSKKDRDKIGDKFISQLTETLGALESGESDD